jgi:tRNA guanosine-2'-O-methyltransferase
VISLRGQIITNVITFLWLLVCEKVIEAAASVVCTFEVPLQILLHFISTLPREFTDYGGK